jgi:hypothetical protein
VDLDVGGQEAIAAVGRAAESFSKAIVAHHRLQADNQFSEAQRQVQEALDLFADNLERDPDTTTFDLRFKEVMGSMKQFAPRNPLAARAFSKLLANVKVNGQRMMLQSKLATERDLFYANRAGEMAQGKFDIAEKKLKKGVRQGLISNKQAQAMLTNIAGERQEAEANSRFLGMLNAARELPTLQEQVKFINSQTGKLSSDATEDRTLRNDAISQLRAEEQLLQEAEDAADEEVKGEINDLINAKQFDVAMTKAGTLNDPDTESLWAGRIRAERKRFATGEDIITDQRVAGTLEEQAFQVRLGAVKLREFVAALDAARYPLEGQPTIDDAEYGRLRSLGTSKFATDQDQTMAEEIATAKGAFGVTRNEQAILALQSAMEAGDKSQTTRDLLLTRKAALESGYEIWSKFRRDLQSELQRNTGWGREEIQAAAFRLFHGLKGSAEFQQGVLTEERTSRGVFTKEERQQMGPLEVDRLMKPVRKGPAKVTKFTGTTAKIVEGKTVTGLITPEGVAIFPGDEYIQGEFVYRYDGNGKATIVRKAPIRKR